jgi:4-oxalocrotonate tautomerase
VLNLRFTLHERRGTEVGLPVVFVEWYAGRTKQQKAELAKLITNDFVKVAGVPPEAVQIVYQDKAKDDWAIGGVLSSER